jgi:cephalosporin hydroxylase
MITLTNRAVPKAPISSTDPRREITDAFHRMYMEARDATWFNTWWMGHRVFKCPFDLWVYQEMFHEIRPDVVVECGTCLGGSALYFAHLCDLLQHGRVITIDIDPPDGKPVHPRITYLQGSSTSPQIVAKIERETAGCERVLVILDSDHHRDHVSNELQIYSRLVTTGSYLIVEDTNINGHPVDPTFGPGPMEAVVDFLKENADFVADPSREKYFMSFNPCGYLKRIR